MRDEKKKKNEKKMKEERMRKGFSLVEMLVVMGIIAALIAASIGGYSAATKSAERAKCREIVSQAAIALATLYERDGAWPKRLATSGLQDGKLDEPNARLLAEYYKLNRDSETGKLIGYDRFGIISPWATDVLKRAGNGATLSTQVSTSRRGPQSIDDHVLHFAVDQDGDGIIEGALVGGESVNVRATAIVWCAGKDGYMEPYTRGLREDDVYSWGPGQTKNVK